jgi:integrase
MKKGKTSRSEKNTGWPRYVGRGRNSVAVYRRKTGSGNFGFMVVNTAGDKRRLDSYPTEEDALSAARELSNRLSNNNTEAAQITDDQAREYFQAAKALEPFGVTVSAAAEKVAECLKLVGDMPGLSAAAKDYADRKLKKLVNKRVPDVVNALLESKRADGRSTAYLKDLTSRLVRFAADFQVDICNVQTANIQNWLDEKKFSPVCYMDFRRRLSLLFTYAMARNYYSKIDGNPVDDVESKESSKSGKIEIFTPEEIAKLLAAASVDFRPVVAIGAFAGVRSAEIQRIEWRDIDLVGRMITIDNDAAKTSSRRLIPMSENLVRWLEPYAGRSGKVWTGSADSFHHQGQDATALAAGVRWKPNGLRRSFCSYRLAVVKSAPQVALEAGNSPQMVFKHYRELAKPEAAAAYFAVSPEAPQNVVTLAAAAANP